MQAVQIPAVPTGTIKTFGKDGVPYLVENLKEQLADGDWLVNIRLLESNETAQYKLSKLLNDPKAS